MKLTKFPQSCILLEKTHKIVIDPGSHFLQTHKTDELKEVSAVLYTHQHHDHYDESIARDLQAAGIPLYANAATAKLIGEGCHVMNDGDTFMVADFTITARDLPHCLLTNGEPGPQNTGYVIDDILFHPGDGKELAGLTVPNLALPITGPDISLLDAINFAKQLQAKVVVPMHYDGIRIDPHSFETYAQKSDTTAEVRVLADGQSTQIA